MKEKIEYIKSNCPSNINPDALALCLLSVPEKIEPLALAIQEVARQLQEVINETARKLASA